MPLLSRVTNIIEDTIVAELDFLIIPIYAGIKFIKENEIEYIKILVDAFTKVSSLNG